MYVIIGSRTKVKVVKNKVAPPFREVEFDIMYGQGISKVGDLLDLAERLEIVQKSGAWFSYNGTRIGQGRDNAKNFLRDNPDIFEEISELVRQNADKHLRKVHQGGSAPKPGLKRPRRKNPPSRRRTPVRTCRQTSTSRSMTTNNEDHGHRPAPPQAFTALY